jgi:hypothetical protein
MMQSIKSLFKILIVLSPSVAIAQSSYIMPGSKDEVLLERLEIKSRFEGMNQSFIRPRNSEAMVKQVMLIDSLQRNQNRIAVNINLIDKYNMVRFLLSNKEWTGNASSFNNKKTPFNLIEVNRPNFFLVVNPALQYSQGFETYDKQSVYYASAGLVSRGLIGKKLGFSFYMTGNQERTPYYVREWSGRFHGVPGVGNFNVTDSNAVRYYDVRASVQWKVAKFIDVQFGHDRNFMGNGIRSLWLSDFSGNAWFLKISTKLWKFDFENLYMELTPQDGIVNQAAEKKYLRINALGINVARWLNVGIFDAVIMGRKNHFELDYIQPFTFLRAMEQEAGSPDNALLGLNLKANLKHNVQLYGQLLLDEFVLKELKANTGYWANKYGYQLGIKYIDAFQIKNLDLQFESNRVRPFTYTHFDSVSNYTHANQPLAHPLGANFQEFILIGRYQPLKKLYIDAKLMYYYQGLDSAGMNFGSNIFIDYNSRAIDVSTGQPRSYGFTVGGGDKATCFYLSAHAAYEIRENLFIDAAITQRNYKVTSGYVENTTLFNIGFRWNMAKRDFLF